MACNEVLVLANVCTVWLARVSELLPSCDRSEPCLMHTKTFDEVNHLYVLIVRGPFAAQEAAEVVKRR